MAEQLTAFEKEQLKCAKKIKEYKLSSEANIVASIYKSPELIYNIDITLDDISNNIWKCYFAIATGILLNEQKNSLDEITFGIYLEKHQKLKTKIDEYGGYDTIKSATAYINISNLDSYVAELKKYNVLLELLKYGFPITESKLSSYVDKTCDQIYSELEMLLNHTFINTESGIESYNAFSDVDLYIDKLNEGADVGLPFANATLLNKETNGMRLGNVTGLGGLSGSGKSLLAFMYLLPSAIEYNEPVVLLVNEEDVSRYRLELLCYVSNNIIRKPVTKYQLRNGNFSASVMEILRECADWIKVLESQHLLTIVPLQYYTCDLAIKVIKKYAKMGVKYFALDTFKQGQDVTEDSYRAMMNDSVRLYDTVKPTGLNVHLLLTYQLNKPSSKIRRYTTDNIGVSKNIVDIMSLNIMVRHVMPDEYPSENKALNCFRIEGKTKIPITLNEDKNYVIIFITKNRFGKADGYQILAEFDMNTDTYAEIGYCSVPVDW